MNLNEPKSIISAGAAEQLAEHALDASSLRRGELLSYLGLGSEQPGDTGKIADNLLSDLSRRQREWSEANTAAPCPLSDPAWAENLVKKMTPPLVMSLVRVKDVADEAAGEEITGLLRPFPNNRLYGGTHGTFMVCVSAEGLRELARLKTVEAIY